MGLSLSQWGSSSLYQKDTLGGLDWIYVALNRDSCGNLINAVINILVE